MVGFWHLVNFPSACGAGGMFMVVKTQVLHIKDVIIVSIKIKGEKNIQK